MDCCRMRENKMPVCQSVISHNTHVISCDVAAVTAISVSPPHRRYRPSFTVQPEVQESTATTAAAGLTQQL